MKGNLFEEMCTNSAVFHLLFHGSFRNSLSITLCTCAIIGISLVAISP